MVKLKWWQAPYLDQRAWILEHNAQLNLNAEELLIVLLIVHHQTKPISLSFLAGVSNLKVKQVDRILDGLVKRKRLMISVVDHQLVFNLEPIFTLESALLGDDVEGVLRTFEQEFKRPLSSREVEKIQHWLTKLPSPYLMHALREAIVYQKLSFSYIDKILITWLDAEVSLEDLNAGKRRAQN
jgi:DNA replication protein